MCIRDSFRSSDDQVSIDPNVVWEPDSRRTLCGRCSASFGLIRRRHHCRGCGVVLCNACCVWNVLPEAFGHGEDAQRVCRWCIQVKFNLLQAAQVGQAPRVRILMCWGIDTSEAADNGSTALHAAAADRSHRGVGAVRCLTEQGFLEDVPDHNGWQPIHIAASVGNIDGIRILVHAGANLNEVTRDEGSTALHLASSEGHVHTAQYLVNTGAGIDAQDACGNTPLHLAVKQGLVPLVVFLIHNGANPRALNSSSQDAFALNDLHSPGHTYESSTPKLASTCQLHKRAPTTHQAIDDALNPRRRGVGAKPASRTGSSPTGTMLGRESKHAPPGARHVQLGTPGGTFRQSLYFDPECTTASLHHPLYPDSSPPPDLSTPSSLSSYELPRSSRSSREQILELEQGISPSGSLELPGVLVMRWRMARHGGCTDRRAQEAPAVAQHCAEQAELGGMQDRRSDLALGSPGLTV
eukprot:TRINITY_DN8444_c0_g1_i4.p1 TRINITY_DN8444_c0_g1~~TRINITY_DN8444_c0_g1_i4.p1  ORF type:complete len:467 (-),score=54.73 TRINITY_DN8444_c0_g1_i4:70-1470(-)